MMMMVSLIAAVAVGVLHAPAAAAHGGPYELEVQNDGAGGVQVVAHYVEDGHRVEAIMDPVVTAVSADGIERGPVRLISSAEGRGRWISEEPFLDTGDWTVTVTTTTPQEVSTTVEFTVEATEPAPAPESAAPEESPSAEPDASDDAADGDEASGMSTWLIVAIVAVAAAVVAGVLVWRRRQS